MSTDKPDAVVVEPPRQIARHVEARTFSLMPSSLGEAHEIATLIANSDFAPKDYKGKPGNVIIAMQMGADLGLKPMQALQNIAVINGRPSIYGDAALALAASVLDRFHESFEGAEKTDNFTAVCVAKRKGWPDETRRTFSVADAKAAGLWGKAGTWTQYPKRMLQFRARSFAIRDAAPDLLLGLVLAEEAMDYPEAIDATVVRTAPVPMDAVATLPEALRDNIELAFEKLHLPAGLRLAKINEFFGKAETTPDDAARGLLEWCRDEFAQRQGKARVPAASNAKTPPSTTTGPPAPSGAGTARAPRADAQAVSAPVVVEPTEAGTGPEMTSADVPFGKGGLTF